MKIRRNAVPIAVALSIILLTVLFISITPLGALANYRRYVNNELNYSITRGNILLIFMSDEDPDPLGTISDDTFDWWKQKVVENQHMNVITLTHQPLYDTVGGSKDRIGYIEDGERFMDILKDYNVCLWMSGHVQHNHEDPDSIVEKWGTTFIDSGSIQIQDPSQRSESRLLEFKVGSREVTVRSREHSTGTWNAELEYSFNLTYAFRMESIHEVEDGDKEITLSIWVFSDIQPRNEEEWGYFQRAVEDANASIDFDIALVLGDLVYVGLETEFQRYLAYLDGSNHPRNDFYHLAGNHEGMVVGKRISPKPLIGNLLLLPCVEPPIDHDGLIGPATTACGEIKQKMLIV